MDSRIVAELAAKMISDKELVNPFVRAAQDVFEIFLGDAGVKELQFGPAWHLLRRAESQTQAYKVAAQQLTPQEVRDQKLESTTFDVHGFLPGPGLGAVLARSEGPLLF